MTYPQPNSFGRQICCRHASKNRETLYLPSSVWSLHGPHFSPSMYDSQACLRAPDSAFHACDIVEALPVTNVPYSTGMLQTTCALQDFEDEGNLSKDDELKYSSHLHLWCCLWDRDKEWRCVYGIRKRACTLGHAGLSHSHSSTKGWTAVCPALVQQ